MAMDDLEPDTKLKMITYMMKVKRKFVCKSLFVSMYMIQNNIRTSIKPNVHVLLGRDS